MAHPTDSRGAGGKRGASGSGGKNGDGSRVAVRKPAPPRSHAPIPSSGLRIPIAIKYAVVTGVLLVLCMVILGRALHSKSVDTADKEINDKGVTSSVLVASSIDPFWAKELEESERLAAQQSLKSDLSTFLKDPGARGVVDVLILDSSASAILASASGKTEVALQSERAVAEDSQARVKIFTGYMKRGEGQFIPAGFTQTCGGQSRRFGACGQRIRIGGGAGDDILRLVLAEHLRVRR